MPSLTTSESARRRIRARRLAAVIQRVELEISERQRVGRSTHDAELLLAEYRSTLATLEGQP